MSKFINMNITENMHQVIDGMPDVLAKLFLESVLDMACIMVQTGDITIDIIGDKT